MKYFIGRAVRLGLLLLLGSLPGYLSSAEWHSIESLWQSQGYGYLLAIKGQLLTVYETTSATCVEAFTARSQKLGSSKWNAVFKSNEESAFFVKFEEATDQAVLHLEDSVPDIQLSRITEMPAVCRRLTQNTPTGNFEVFTRTWAENYISFDLRHTDWDKIVAEYRSKITPQTTPAQLFDILEAMIKPLGDLHAYVAARALKRSSASFWRPGTSSLIEKPEEFANRGRWKLFAITDRAYLQATPKMFCRKHLQYGHVTDSIGYLRILSFGGYSRKDDSKALESALDSIFSDSHLRALVIDMRFSFGGSDELGLAIARRLTIRDYLAYTVQARSDPLDRGRWTSGDPIMVQPSARPGFHGPIVELISSITMSGAETFSEALMGRTPHVTRIGENTQGVFCDVLDRHLPNKWTFGLPNAVYRTADKKAFDVTGIPPDIEVPVFDAEDIAAGKDPAMAKAVQIL